MSEIERRFLVSETPRAEGAQAAIEQGYLALDDRAEVRLRRIGDELLLTVKNGSGQVREEVEVPIEPSAFESLWPLSAGRRVRKVRHYVPLADGLRAELDIYTGALDGLRTVEVEFDSLAAAERFSPPAWMGREVTGDERYSNRTLATAGLPDGMDAGDGGVADRPGGGRRREDAGVSVEEAEDERAAAESDASDPGSATEAQPGPSRGYKLRADEDAAEGIRRVIAGRLEKAAERLRESDEGDALAEAIHGARKDIKKARAALRLIRASLGEKTFRRENRALRDAGRLLSASRDAEVKLATMEALIEGGGAAPPGATAIWRDALRADRDRVTGESGAGGGDAVVAATDAVAQVGVRLPGWKIRDDGWDLLAPGLDTAYREGRAEFRALPEEPHFDAVHELRKRAKDLWYQTRLLTDAWPEVIGATAAEIHSFTELLGDHHDLAVLADDLGTREEIEPVHRATLRALIEARQANLLAEARALGALVYAEKPTAFGRRMRALWRASRRPAPSPASTSS